MEEQITALMRIIGEEIALYRDLLVHARKKTALLVRGSVAAILESNKADETVSVKLRQLEDQMARLAGQLAKAMNIAPEELTLLKLADEMKPPDAAEIRSQSVTFRSLVDQLMTINQRNRKLIESSLRYSRGLLDFIADATSSYQSNGLFHPYSAAHPTVIGRA